MAIDKQIFKFNCPHPWFGMSVSYSGNISVDCCDYSFSGINWQNINSFNLKHYWNSTWYHDLRRIFQGNSLSGTGCEWCTKTDLLYNIYNPKTPECLNPIQLSNYTKALEAYNERKENVEHFPVNYTFDFGRQCNLDCIMCNQADVKNSDNGTQLSADMLMTQVDVLKYANSIYLFGGEPLLISESRKMLNFMLTHPKLYDVELRLVTNGVLLDNFLDNFLKKERIHITVSFDSVREGYEKIRRGASWKKVSKNIDRFLSLKIKYAKNNWNFTALAVFMKTTLKYLPDHVAWCLERDIVPWYGPLIATRHTQNEDVLSRPYLLKEIPEWRHNIDRAVDMLKERNHFDAADKLNKFKNVLLKNLDREEHNTKHKKEHEADTLLQNRLQFSQFAEKNVVIWGTGSNYRQSVAPWLKKQRYEINLLGFIDNNPDLHGKQIDGATVYSPRELERWGNIDVLIVASVHRSQIINQLKRMNVNVGSVI
jgi:molybdenum cofactor biosynthesis enzyme MoaA